MITFDSPVIPRPGSSASRRGATVYDQATATSFCAAPRPPAPPADQRPPGAVPGPASPPGPAQNSGTLLATLVTLGVVGGLLLWVTSGPDMAVPDSVTLDSQIRKLIDDGLSSREIVNALGDKYMASDIYTAIARQLRLSGKSAASVSRTNPAGLKYSERKGWTGANERALYHVSDPRTYAQPAQILPGWQLKGVGENATIRLATRTEADAAGWPAGWIVADDAGRKNPSSDDEPFKDEVTKRSDIIIRPEEIFAFTPAATRTAMKLAVSKLRDIPLAVAHAVTENVAPHVNGYRLPYGGQQGTYLWIQKSYQSPQLEIMVLADTEGSFGRPRRPEWMNDLQSVGFRHTTFGSAAGMKWNGVTPPRAARTNPRGPEPGT